MGRFWQVQIPGEVVPGPPVHPIRVRVPGVIGSDGLMDATSNVGLVSPVWLYTSVTTIQSPRVNRFTGTPSLSIIDSYQEGWTEVPA
jgi:hypothetical protein